MVGKLNSIFASDFKGAGKPTHSIFVISIDYSGHPWDVFHVLSRKPSVPEWVVTQQYVYRIEPDRTINYVMTREAFLKMREK